MPPDPRPLEGTRREEFSGSTLPTPGTMFDDCETCRSCKRPVGVEWWTTDAALWDEVAAEAMGDTAASLCIRCFDIHARRLGHQPHWSPTLSLWRTRTR